MKMLLAIFALTLSLAAQADTIELYSKPGFGYLHQYHGVENSADADVSIYAPQSIGKPCYVILDGISYGSLTACGILAGVLTDALTGNTVTVTLVESFYRKRISSGRANYYGTVWMLLSGTIERPLTQ